MGWNCDRADRWSQHIDHDDSADGRRLRCVEQVLVGSGIGDYVARLMKGISVSPIILVFLIVAHCTFLRVPRFPV